MKVGKTGGSVATAILTNKQRAVCELYVQGITHKQIATHLALSESTVRSHLRLAVRKAKLLVYGDAAATNDDAKHLPDH